MWSTDQGFAVAQVIITGQATGISDGTFKYNRDTVACIIEFNNNINSHIYAVYDTPGNKTDQSPYRSEIGEFSMMLLILQCVIRYHGITQRSIQLGLDGKKATEQASGKFLVYPKQRSFDMLVDIRTKIKLLLTLLFVEGRQLQRHRRQSNMGKATINVTTWQKCFGKWKRDPTVYLINFFAIHLWLFRSEVKW